MSTSENKWLEADNGEKTLFSICEDLLCPQGWLSFRCSICARVCLAPTARNTCQSPRCFRISPVAHGKRRRSSLEAVWSAVRHEFGGSRFANRRINDLRNRDGDPLFIIAAIQNFDPEIYLGAPIPVEPFLIAQPTIRMKYFDEVANSEGFSTAFINIGSYQFNATPNIYQSHLMTWLSTLANIGLSVPGLTVTLESTPFDAGPYWGRYVLINYRGIELGEAIYISRAALSNGKHTSLVEMSFGLERILWAVSGTVAYHRNFGPMLGRLDDDPFFVDSARCACLLAMSGFTPSKHRHYRMRKTVARMATVLNGRDVGKVVRECYAEWLPFIDPVRDVEACVDLLTREVDRQLCLGLARELGVSASQLPYCTTREELVARLLDQGRSIDELCGRLTKMGRAAVQDNK